MGQVRVTVNGRKYDIACDDGQESHLEQLATHVDERMADLVNVVGQIGEARLLLMACLLVTDELFEARHRGKPSAGDSPVDDGSLSDIAGLIGDLAGRIENVADRVQEE